MIASPLERLLEQLRAQGTVREIGRDRHMTRCPAHEDRSASLSVGLGRDGRVLLKCFAGCEVPRICAALGVTLRSLMPVGDPEAKRREDAERAAIRKRYRATPDRTIRELVGRETKRQRDERVRRNPHDTPHVRGADVVEAVRRSSLILGVPIPPPRSAVKAWEGWSPHDTDPAWPVLFRRACDELAIELWCYKWPRASLSYAPAALHLPRRLHDLAAERAASWLHALAKEDVAHA